MKSPSSEPTSDKRSDDDDDDIEEDKVHLKAGGTVMGAVT